MKIRGKILSIVAVMGAVTCVLVCTALTIINKYDTKIDDLEIASQKVYNGEHLNRLITTVVMDSRGIYAADSTASASTFAKEMGTNLAKIDVLLAEWGLLIKDRERPNFQKIITAAKEFAVFRSETSRLGTQVSPQAAAAQGNNDQNRAIRKSFQGMVDQVVKIDRENLQHILEDVDNFYSRNLWTLLFISGAGLVLGTAIAIYISASHISSPLARLIAAINRLQNGHLDEKSNEVTRNDELGQLWKAVDNFRDALRETETMRVQQKANEISSVKRRHEEMNNLAGDFETNVGLVINQLSEASQKLNHNAQAMGQLAISASEQAINVSSAAEQASMNVQMVAGASEELSSTIAEVATQIAGTSTLAQEASCEARNTTASVGHLQEVVNRVSAFTNLISEIAEKTNLLALNATIEAARAGEAGRGFAVVASEVKQLAEQTSKATEEITRQIKDMETAAGSSINAVERISQMIDRINQTASTIAAAAEEQGTATAEIARNVSEVATGTASVSRSIGSVSQAVGKTGHMSEEVSQSSNMLNEQIRHLSGQVQNFLSRIRAA
jgi:methyl-accepting chemotaxis protein